MLIPLVAIALAELGDKTQISILVLSSKTTKHIQLLGGVIFAFLIVDGIAILAGTWITTIIPIRYITTISGLIFILFGMLMLLNRDEPLEKTRTFNSIFTTAFLLIFLTEWGDKTQIAAALFATRYNPYMVLAGTLISLSVLSLLAIFFGKILSKRLPKKTIQTLGGIIFIILGVSFIIL